MTRTRDLGKHIDGKRGWLIAKVEWNPHDLWIGVFHRRSGIIDTVWICIVPCLPIRIDRIIKSRRNLKIEARNAS